MPEEKHSTTESCIHVLCLYAVFLSRGAFSFLGHHHLLGYYSVFNSDYDVVYMEFVEDQMIFYAESPNHPVKT